MRKFKNHYLDEGFSRLEEDIPLLFSAAFPFYENKMSGYFYNNRFKEKFFTSTLEHFEFIMDCLQGFHDNTEYLFEEFEKEYRRYFGDETTSFSPPIIYMFGKISYLPDNYCISSLNFNFISDFEEILLIDKYGHQISLSDQILNIYRNDFKLFFSVDNEEKFNPLELDSEEIYPDIHFELTNKEYLNDQGFYKELYNEMINQIFS